MSDNAEVGPGWVQLPSSQARERRAGAASAGHILNESAKRMTAAVPAFAVSAQASCRIHPPSRATRGSGGVHGEAAGEHVMNAGRATPPRVHSTSQSRVRCGSADLAFILICQFL